jgi:hypothetical protein
VKIERLAKLTTWELAAIEIALRNYEQINPLSRDILLRKLAGADSGTLTRRVGSTVT